ncbi:hypothetical protein BCR42DRAFT_390217 [Absidia repens]|uniref:Uncharacterized protein n=1 Tax=Absidia repens TaxID=90262 RepID=A0A1X2INH3_9FUNG|nr:hypothetical protein BCR42DRAFT_390217 [Absidia repens]
MIIISFKHLVIIYLYFLFSSDINLAFVQILFGVLQLLGLFLWHRRTEALRRPSHPTQQDLQLQLFDMARSNDELLEQVRFLQNRLDNLQDTINTWEQHMILLE